MRTPKEIAARRWRLRGTPPPDLNDSISQGVWVGHALPHYRRLTSHPLFMPIHGRLVAGISSWRVAHWIQQNVEPNDVFGAAKIKVDSLARSLRRYTKLLPKSTFLPASLMEELIQGAEIDVDVMQELGALIVYQKQRLTLADKVEKQMQIPLPQVTEQVKVLADLYRQMRDTQIALGYAPAHRLDGMTVGHGANQAAPVLRRVSELEDWMSHHPQYVARVVPILKALTDLDRDIAVDEAGLAN